MRTLIIEPSISRLYTLIPFLIFLCIYLFTFFEEQKIKTLKNFKIKNNELSAMNQCNRQNIENNK